MKRITLFSFAFVLACGLSPASSGQTSSTQTLTIVNNLWESCGTVMEHYPGTRKDCVNEAKAWLSKNRNIDNVRRIPNGTKIPVRSTGLPERGNALPAQVGSSLEQIQLGNDVRVLQDQVADIRETTNTTAGEVAEIKTGVQTLVERPAGTVEVPQETTWLLYGIAGISLLGLLFAFLIFGAVRSNRNLKEGVGIAKPMAVPPYEPSKAREALVHLTALVAHDEALENTNKTLSEELKRVNTELDELRKKEQELAEKLKQEIAQQEVATQKAKEAKEALRLAEADKATSQEEIIRLRDEVARTSADAAREKAERETAEDNHRKALQAIRKEEERTLDLTRAELEKT